jgi:hypothetical protein
LGGGFARNQHRYRSGRRIAPALAESGVNSLVARRMVKKQQMQWSKRGHLLLQVRAAVLNGDLRERQALAYCAVRGWDVAIEFVEPDDVVLEDGSSSTSTKPRNCIANRRIIVNSADPAFSVSTLAACRSVIWPRGLTQSAAVSGEIARPVIGSSVRTRTGASWRPFETLSQSRGATGRPKGRSTN